MSQIIVIIIINLYVEFYLEKKSTFFERFELSEFNYHEESEFAFPFKLQLYRIRAQKSS